MKDGIAESRQGRAGAAAQRRPAHSGLPAKMALSISAVLAVFVVLAALVAPSLFQNVRKAAVIEQNTLIVSMAVENIDTKLRLVHRALIDVAAIVPLAALTDPDAAQSFLDRQAALHSLFDNGLFLISLQGKLVAESPFKPDRRGRDISEREFYQRTLATRRPYISKPYRSTHNPGQPAVIMTAPLFDPAGEMVGLIEGSLDLLGSLNILAELAKRPQGASGYLFLSDGRETMISHPDKSRIMQPVSAPGQNALFDRAVAGWDGSGETVTSRGVPALATYQHLPSTGWLLGAVVPSAEAYASIYRARRLFLGVLCAITLLALPLVWLLMRRLTRPLVHMTSQVREIALGQGARTRVDVVTRDEIGDVATTFNDFLDAMDTHRAERERLVSILEATPDLVAIADPLGNISYLNRAGRAMTRWSDKPLSPLSLAQMHPAWAADLIARQAIPTAVRDGSWSGETALLGADGREIPVSQVILSHRDASGEVKYLSMTMRDISERRRAQEQLQRSYAQHQAITEAVHDNLFMVDPSGTLVWWNRRVEETTGKAPAQLRGAPALNFFDERDRPAVALALQEAFVVGSAEVVARLLTPVGPVEYEYTGRRVLDAGGNVIGVAGSGRDISERKRNEQTLQHLNEGLERRVEERTAEMAAARDEAERANRAKSEFLSRMSHELRTPLNAILGFGQLLEIDPRIAGKEHDWVLEIGKGGRHLLELINEVLDLARVESGQFSVSLEPVALLPLVQECLAMLRPQAQARHIALPEAARRCDVQVQADRTRLKQVLLNLLSNAIKYNREAGSVGIGCEADEGGVRIQIDDSGAGLTPEQQARLFVPFERLDADQKHIEGTGIGLALSKRLVELMGGQIGVDSQPGQGSRFWVRLPAAQGWSEHAPSLHATLDDVASAGGEGERTKVLCIEDNPANLRLIEGLLALRPDIHLLTAAAPGLGLELARAHRPALILLDINLPDMDGYAVLRCLRENEITRDIPVLAVSANAMLTDIERGKAAGFADYVTKPINVARLLASIDRWLGT